MIDFHTHILPGIDDGASNAYESLQILQMLKSQGIDTVLATPHYYGDYHTVDGFLSARGAAYQKLMQAVHEANVSVPKIILGAEVRLSYELIQDAGLKRLCIGDTKCVLTEMSDGYWFEWVYDAVRKMKEDMGLIPVIAHLERYADSPPGMGKFERLFMLDVPIQINADAAADFKLWRNVKALMDKNRVHIIGSDSHNVSARRPRMDVAYRKISKKYGTQRWAFLQKNAEMLLDGNRIHSGS